MSPYTCCCTIENIFRLSVLQPSHYLVRYTCTWGPVSGCSLKKRSQLSCSKSMQSLKRYICLLICHFHVTLCICFRISPWAKLLVWNLVWFEWKWTCRGNTFSYDYFHRKTYFDTEVACKLPQLEHKRAWHSCKKKNFFGISSLDSFPANCFAFQCWHVWLKVELACRLTQRQKQLGCNQFAAGLVWLIQICKLVIVHVINIIVFHRWKTRNLQHPH